MLEEVGAEIKITGEVGKIIERRIYEDMGLIQTSYCYMAEIISLPSNPNFTQHESSLGFELRWENLAEAIRILEKDKPVGYEGKHIRIRDLAFLREAKIMMDKK